MNFQHTEDRRMLADTLGRFIGEQMGFEARMATVKQAQGFDRRAWQQLCDVGAAGALFSEADGGYGGQGFDIAVVFEAIGHGLALTPALPVLLAGSAVAHAGNAEQKAMLGGLIDGSQVATLAHEEPCAFHDIRHVTTQAERNADGWLLQGRKTAVPAKTAGLTFRGFAAHDGGRTADVTLDQVSLPASALLGEAGQGHATLEHAVGLGVLALCAESLGSMEAAKRMTIEYLQTRKQFGVPIGSFQALQHRMADVLLEVEQARSAVINAAAVLGGERLARERALSAAKVSIGRIGTLVAQEAIQLHGGIGMTWELALAHHAKRLILIDHQLGDEDHHLARFIELGRAA